MMMMMMMMMMVMMMMVMVTMMINKRNDSHTIQNASHNPLPPSDMTPHVINPHD